jgi:hypothetical protein
MKASSASDYSSVVSGEIGSSRAKSQPNDLAAASGEIPNRARSQSVHRSGAIEIPRSPDEITQPNLRASSSPSVRVPSVPPKDEPRGAILGIGMAAIGSGAVAGEIPSKVPPGGRVLVPGPNGLMQSATVRQLLSGYYELEVGSSGETIWVPMNGVVPE